MFEYYRMCYLSIWRGEEECIAGLHRESQSNSAPIVKFGPRQRWPGHPVQNVCAHTFLCKKVKEGAAVRPSFTWLQAGTEGQRTLSNLERIILELWYKSICGKEHPPPLEHPLETRHI